MTDTRATSFNLRRLVKLLYNSASIRKGALAVVAQGVVSAANFLTTVIIGRTTSPEELGVYSLAFGVLGLSLVLESALVFSPYSVYGNRYEADELRRYAGGSLVLFTLVMILTTGIFAIAGLLSVLGLLAPQQSMLFCTLAAILPVYLLHALARRFCFAHLQFGKALVIDSVRSVVHVAVLLAFAAWGNLSARTAFVSTGLACGLTGCVWLVTNRHRFVLVSADVRAAISRNFAFGKWLLGSESIARLRLIVTAWILALTIGTAFTGIYAALASLVTLINPIVMGFNNVFGPKAAKAYARGGAAKLSALMWKGSLMLGGILLLYILFMFIAGNTAVTYVYDGTFLGHALTISVMAAARAMGLYGGFVGSGLRAIERPDITFRCNLLGVAVTILVSLLLVYPWQLLGVACGSLAGNTLATAGASFSFWRQMGTRQSAQLTRIGGG